MSLITSDSWLFTKFTNRNWSQDNYILPASQKYSPLFITARKRNLRRIWFYTCLSFCPWGGGGICPIACWDTHTPWDQRQHPEDQRQAPPRTRGKYPPEQTPHPGSRHPLGPEAGTPPSAVHAGRYGQQASGTHPIGIQSYFVYDFWSAYNRYYTLKGNIGNCFKRNIFKLFLKQDGIYSITIITKAVLEIVNIVHNFERANNRYYLEKGNIDNWFKWNLFKLFLKNRHLLSKKTKKQFQPMSLFSGT